MQKKNWAIKVLDLNLLDLKYSIIILKSKELQPNFTDLNIKNKSIQIKNIASLISELFKKIMYNSNFEKVIVDQINKVKNKYI